MSYTNEDQIIQYYINQAGSGVGSIYSGPLYVKGYGIGSWLGGLFRAVVPFIKSRGMSVGKQLLKTGVDVLSDVQQNKTFKESLKDRRGDIFENMTEAIMKGKGFMRRKGRTVAASRSSSTLQRNKIAKAKIKNKNRKLTRADILGRY
jgi:hypothetical protein